MGRYIQRRLLISIPLLVLISILSFLLLQLTPGDPIDAYLPPDAAISDERREAMRKNLGLDRPLPVQYGNWLVEAVQGNLGLSSRSYEPVTDVIAGRVGPTLLLMLVALVVGVTTGLILGILGAFYRNSGLDVILTAFAVLGISVPVYLAGLLGLYVFSLKLGWFPTGGFSTPGSSDLWDRIQHLILPAFLISIQYVAQTMRYTRSAMISSLSQDYVRTARAKGLLESRIVIGHALRNAMIPIATIIGSYIPALIAGAVFIETIFSWPGMGRLFVDSVNYRDYPVIMGLTLVLAIIILLANLLTDVAYALIDPRIRYE
jgi:peptide/nickel transport system permease protein